MWGLQRTRREKRGDATGGREGDSSANNYTSAFHYIHIYIYAVSLLHLTHLLRDGVDGSALDRSPLSTLESRYIPMYVHNAYVHTYINNYVLHYILHSIKMYLLPPPPPPPPPDTHLSIIIGSVDGAGPIRAPSPSLYVPIYTHM